MKESCIRHRLRTIYWNRLRRSNCQPWKLEHLFIQRSLVRNNMKLLGGQLARDLSNKWALSIVESWPKPNDFNEQLSKELIVKFEQYGLPEACSIVRSFNTPFYIPLEFWFRRNPALALPRISLNY